MRGAAGRLLAGGDEGRPLVVGGDASLPLVVGRDAAQPLGGEVAEQAVLAMAVDRWVAAVAAVPAVAAVAAVAAVGQGVVAVVAVAAVGLGMMTVPESLTVFLLTRMLRMTSAWLGGWATRMLTLKETAAGVLLAGRVGRVACSLRTWLSLCGST